MTGKRQWRCTKRAWTMLSHGWTRNIWKRAMPFSRRHVSWGKAGARAKAWTSRAWAKAKVCLGMGQGSERSNWRSSDLASLLWYFGKQGQFFGLGYSMLSPRGIVELLCKWKQVKKPNGYHELQMVAQQTTEEHTAEAHTQHSAAERQEGGTGIRVCAGDQICDALERWYLREGKAHCN